MSLRERRITIWYGRLDAPQYPDLSRVDLIINQEAVGRKQDLAEVETLRVAEVREKN